MGFQVYQKLYLNAPKDFFNYVTYKYIIPWMIFDLFGLEDGISSCKFSTKSVAWLYLRAYKALHFAELNSQLPLSYSDLWDIFRAK